MKKVLSNPYDDTIDAVLYKQEDTAGKVFVRRAGQWAPFRRDRAGLACLYTLAVAKKIAKDLKLPFAVI